MTEIVMTSNTANTMVSTSGDSRSTWSLVPTFPTVAFAAAISLWSHQPATITKLKSDAFDLRSSTQLTAVVPMSIFDELIDFQQRLESIQADLPVDAAKVLRENLWQLYE